MLFTMSGIAATWRGDWDNGNTQRRDDPSSRGSGRFPRVWGHVPRSPKVYLGLHDRGYFASKWARAHSCRTANHGHG